MLLHGGQNADVSHVGLVSCAHLSQVVVGLEQVSIPAKEVTFLVVVGPLDLWYCL